MLAIAVLVVAAVLVSGAGLHWRSNTHSLQIDAEYPGVAHSGETITVNSPGGCAGPMRRLYRESLHRWRRTHRGNNGAMWNRDDIHWWDRPTRIEVDDLACGIGPSISITIPKDVTWCRSSRARPAARLACDVER